MIRMIRGEGGRMSRAVRLSVGTAVLAQWMSGAGPDVPARSFLLRGLPLAVGLTLLAALVRGGELLRQETGAGTLARWGMLVWLGAEWLGAVRDAQRLCWEQFGSMAVIGILPLLLAAGWTLPAEGFTRAARILWVLAGVGILLCVAGLWGQLRWESLVEPPLPGADALSGGGVRLPVYAGYFLLPDQPEQAEGKGRPAPVGWLPVEAFLLEGGCRLGMEMVFGPADGSPGSELLRVWTLGMFSRMDALFLLLWLTAALFRICFLLFLIRGLLRQLAQPATRRLPGTEAGR